MTREEIFKKMEDIYDVAIKGTIKTLCTDCNKDVCDERQECGSFDDCVYAAKEAIILFLSDKTK